jgi:hypothetical protein
MSKQIDALKLALEALEAVQPKCDDFHHKKKEMHDWSEACKPLERYNQAITAIKEHLDKKWSDYPCYEWQGYKTNLGYGQLGTAKKLGKNLYAHRIVWEAVNGPIPKGLSLDHLCRNPSCISPHHLEPVTHKENCLRGVGVGAINSKKTHCKTGHAFDELNTGYLKDGKRYCKECQRLATEIWRSKNDKR